MFMAVTRKQTTFSRELHEIPSLGAPDFWFGDFRGNRDNALLVGEGKVCVSCKCGCRPSHSLQA